MQVNCHPHNRTLTAGLLGRKLYAKSLLQIGYKISKRVVFGVLNLAYVF